MQSICIIKKKVFFFKTKSQVSDLLIYNNLTNEEYLQNVSFY